MQVQNPGDKEITCVDCGEKFWFTERDQQFYKEKQYSEPKRCRDCRAKKKANWEHQQKERGYKK
jgi:hypothetical protein